MEPDVHYTLVGAFVIVLTAFIVLGIIWLSSGFKFEKYNSYLVYMQESVSGLSVDSSVEYNGVDVGTVKSIALNRRNPALVEVIVSIKSTTPITRGTVATLTTRGLTGVVYIALKEKTKDPRSPLTPHGAKYPVIQTAPSIFVRLDAALTQINNSFERISASIQSVLDQENLNAIKATLANLKTVTGTLAVNSKQLDSILANTSRASQQFEPLLQSSKRALGMLEIQTLPATYRVLTNLDEVSRTLLAVSGEIKDNPSILIRGTSTPPLGPGEAK